MSVIEPTGKSPPDAMSFAAYLAKRFEHDKGYRGGVPEEARALAEASDFSLTLADFGLALTLIHDDDLDGSDAFRTSSNEVLAIGRACLKYTGTMNGAKLPVAFRLIQVASRAPAPDERARMKALQRSMPGLKKVAVNCFWIDTSAATVFSPALFNGLFRGRRWLESLLRKPRVVEQRIDAASLAEGSAKPRPVATIGILLALVAAFVVEQFARVGEAPGGGPLGIDARSLYALGGMNHDAVVKGEWSRLFTAALLHVDAIHLLLNGLALALAGYFFETTVGAATLLAVFTLGALGGSFAGFLVNDPSIVSVGASGAVMALLAAAFATTARVPPGPRRSQIQVSLARFLIPSLIPLATSRSGHTIDYAAHFGGAIIGAAAGAGLLAIWPKHLARPRYKTGLRVLAAASVACFFVSGVVAQHRYHELAGELAAVDLLVPDAIIPEDHDEAARTVETWGRDNPRDPRVHLFRALAAIKSGDDDKAERELVAGLSEREIFAHAFPSRELESAMRSMLCTLLVKHGRLDDAKREARPVCDVEPAKEHLRELGLCE